MNKRLQKIRWQARRGMLELDTLFSEYFSKFGEQLDNDQLDDIERLLLLQDQVLFDAFSGKQPLEDEGMQSVFREVMNQVGNLSSS